MADESWLEAGDIPQVAIQTVRDDFAPFTFGTVIVGTTGEEVVDVHGSNTFIQKANDLGNNDVFADLPDGDPYTDAARALYGTSWEGLPMKCRRGHALRRCKDRRQVGLQIRRCCPGRWPFG